MRLQGGRSLLSLKGNEERKAITSHFSSPSHTFLLFITLPLFLVLCLFALKLSFVVTLLHLLPGCLVRATVLSQVSARRATIPPSLCFLGTSSQLEILLGFIRRSAPLRSHGRPGGGQDGKRG